MGVSSSRTARRDRGASVANSVREESVVAPIDDIPDVPASSPPVPNASTVSEDTLPSSSVDAPADPKKTVRVLEVHDVETYEDETNQTGLSEYEMKYQDKFFLTPERTRGRAYLEAKAADDKKREDKKARKERRSMRRRSKKKGQEEPDEIIPNTIPWAIQSAKRLGVLNLSKMHLESIPDDVFESVPGTTRIINVSSNNMVELDPRICDYVLVQRLIANANAIATLHPNIRKMTALRKLDIAHNKLTSLPDAFYAMHQLEVVDVRHNQLTDLPISFSSLNLTDLYLGGNKFTAPPAAIEGIEGLQVLDMSSNQLTAIPETWMSFIHLITLNLDKNQIADCPNIILQRCVDLCTFSLRGNPIKMADLEAKDAFQQFEERRRVKLKRQLDSGTIALVDLEPADR